MESLLDKLIGYVWAVEVAGVDVIHAGGNGLAQYSDRTRNIARWPPHHFAAIFPRKLHGAIAHSVYGHGCVGKGKRAAKIGSLRHLSPRGVADECVENL